MKDSIHDQKKEAREAIAEVVAKLHKIDRASSDIGVAFEELQDMEKGKRAASDARDLVNYGWRLQVLQAVLLLLLTSGVGVASREVYNYYSHKRTYLQPRNMPIIEPTQK
jgi:hypothetical protein